MAANHPGAPRRVSALGPRILALRPEIEAATGVRLGATAEGFALHPARRGLRAAVKRLGRPCLLVAPGPLDAPRTDPGQAPTSLVLAWDGAPPRPAAGAMADRPPDLPRALAALALMRRLGLPVAKEAGREERVEGPEAAARFARRYLDAPTYFDAWRRHPIPFEEAAAQAAWLRDRVAGNGRGFVLVGVSRWKRRSVSSLLAAPSGPPRAARSAPAAVAAAAREGRAVAAWATRMPAGLPGLCAGAGVPLWRLEDGFVRSVGLGASFRPGASVVLDRTRHLLRPRRGTATSR